MSRLCARLEGHDLNGDELDDQWNGMADDLDDADGNDDNSNTDTTTIKTALKKN